MLVIALSFSTKSLSEWASIPGGSGCFEPEISLAAFSSRQSFSCF